MSHPEYHGTQEALDEFMTVGIDLAVRVAHQRRVSRLQREEAARADERDAWRAEQAKQDLDRATASVKWAAVQSDDWWENATPERILDAYREAKTYEPEDQTAAGAVVRLNTEIRDRFAIDVDELGRVEAPAEELERLYADHIAQHAAIAAADELADAGRRGEVMAGLRDYFLSRSLATVSNAGSIEDVAAMSPGEGQPQARRTRRMPGQERDRGR
ncbi:MAG: hypothetical protein ACLP50_01445 [Solirubrobacteraceae bacterium]